MGNLQIITEYLRRKHLSIETPKKSKRALNTKTALSIIFKKMSVSCVVRSESLLFFAMVVGVRWFGGG